MQFRSNNIKKTVLHWFQACAERSRVINVSYWLEFKMVFTVCLNLFYVFFSHKNLCPYIS